MGTVRQITEHSVRLLEKPLRLGPLSELDSTKLSESKVLKAMKNIGCGLIDSAQLSPWPGPCRRCRPLPSLCGGVDERLDVHLRGAEFLAGASARTPGDAQTVPQRTGMRIPLAHLALPDRNLFSHSLQT